VLPVLDSVTLFHLHDNLGARRGGTSPPELDPLRLDLHLPPGRGSVPWQRITPLLAAHDAPLLLEVHPPHRSPPGDLFAEAYEALFPRVASSGGPPRGVATPQRGWAPLGDRTRGPSAPRA
jgi:sugar phosphate isomerase/epimerase